MIDLDEIEQAARKPWYCRSRQEDNLLSPEVLVELITRLRQAENDAARYRWLRDYHIGDCPEHINLDGDGSLDGAIDEAMNGSNN